MKPHFFSTNTQFHRWLERNHNKVDELWVGFYKKSSGKKSISYPEALDEALCYGWIDGLRKAIDDSSYTIRFTPRKPKSIWSLVNVKHVERLSRAGLMRPAGLQAFALRQEAKTGVYSFENRPKEFSDEYQQVFQANEKAWEFFQKQPAYFRKTSIFWVMSARKEETRQRRLNQLIDASQREERLGLITAKSKTP